MGRHPKNDTSKPGKVCTGCEQFKVWSEFHRDKCTADGFQTRCKQCKKQHRAENYSKTNEKRRERYHNDTTFRESILHRRKILYWNLPEKFREISMRWMRLHPDLVKEHRRAQWGKNIDHNRTLKRMAQARRDAAKRNLPDTLTSDEWLAILESYNGECAYKECGIGSCSGKITIDHVIPISRGGGNTKENVVPACEFHNYSKRNRLINEWIRDGRALDLVTRAVGRA